MKSYCLASSSSGNCFVFEFEIDGKPHLIMVECGLPIKEIYSKLNELNIQLSTIEACLITHAHQDHCKSAKQLLNVGIPLFATQSSFEAISCKGNIIYPKTPKKLLNGLSVMAFEVEHDIEGAVGFVIKSKTETVIFVNDHKMWRDNLINFKPDYVFIECNYDHKVVYAQYYELKKQKAAIGLNSQDEREINIKLAQHERNLNAHCSLAGTIKGLSKLNLKNCKAIFLMHLSDRYANEYRMKNEIQNRFHIRTYVCLKKGGIK